MRKTLTFIKNLLLYAGLSKTDYDKIKDAYNAPNWLVLNISSFFMAVVMLGYSIYSGFTNAFADNIFVYVTVCVVSSVVFVLNLLKGKENNHLVSILTNIFCVLIYYMGIVNGSIMDQDHLAVAIIVSIVVLPLIFNARPVSLLSGMIIADIIFIIMAAAYKSPEIASLDILDAVTFAFVSLILVSISSYSKAKGYLSNYKFDEHYSVLASMAGIYYSMHLIDLEKDTLTELRAINEVKEIADTQEKASEAMRSVMESTVVEEYREKVLEFSDVTTVADRMQNKQIISAEFIGKHIGWFRAQFIAIDVNSDGKPSKVIFTTISIDAEKKHEELLVSRSQTDELTGFYNRRAYEEVIYEHNNVPKEEDFVYISLDVNGLKVVNDTLGHAAGDELLKGACQCMRQCFGVYGHLYRTGGDEFAVVVFAEEEELRKMLRDFNEALEGWSGELVKSVTVSYGCVAKRELPNASIRELAMLADKRMYEAKSRHYRKSGVDRRGQKDAHVALYGLYTTILQVDLKSDEYQIVNISEDEKTAEMGFSTRFSSWIRDFGTSGNVYPEDLPEYLRLTDRDYLIALFEKGSKMFRVPYRRRCGDRYRRTILEIIPANDYSKDNQTVFLYVKYIED